MQNYNSSATLPKLYKVLTLFVLMCAGSLNAQFAGSGPTIVLDAGHGGHDDGASGKMCSEKQITLALAKKIQLVMIDQMPDAAVYFTRQTDTFLPLHARAKYANDLDADLFISIHCNAMPGNHKHVRGTETYVMGLHKAAENLAVAQRENAAIKLETSPGEHYADFDINSPASYITLNHIQDQYMQQSISLAKSIEDAFSKRHPGKSKGVKQAGFLVLHQVSMPGILIEAGYLTNAEDEKYLCSDAGQWQIAEMIADGIANYLGKKPAHPQIAMNTPAAKSATTQRDDYIYKIQLAAMKSSPPPQSRWRKNPDFEIIQEDHIYRVVYGSFLSLQEASKAKSDLQREGYKDAFVIKFLNDKRVN